MFYATFYLQPLGLSVDFHPALPHPFGHIAVQGAPVTDMTPILERGNATRTIRVTKGLFVLRYVASKAGLNAPSLAIRSAPSSGVDLIWPNSSQEGRLVSPGDAMVVRAERDSFVDVTVTPSHRNGSCDAELVLERVSTSLALNPPSDPATVDPESLNLDEIEILAHVARRGDVLAKAGQWICGPDLPMAIEGLEFRWPSRPHGVDIVSRATINAKGLRSLPEQSIGSFLGTRGRAAPITSLALALDGPGARDLVLSCDALFLGLPVVTASGASCVLRGATGLEPLVGFRLSVATATEQAALRTVGVIRSKASEVAPAPVAVPAPARVERSGRVRIFRTSRVKSSPAYSLAK
jgi:hypothetical protein